MVKTQKCENSAKQKKWLKRKFFKTVKTKKKGNGQNLKMWKKQKPKNVNSQNAKNKKWSKQKQNMKRVKMHKC